jgi:hypothetical protein
MNETERDAYESLFEHFSDFQNELLQELQESVPAIDPDKLPD